MQIAASIPPLRSSFQPNSVVADDILAYEYGQLVASIQDNHSADVDIFQIETLSCIREVLACLAVVVPARRRGQQVWLGVGVYENACLPSGEHVVELLEALVREGYLTCQLFGLMHRL